MDTGWMTEGMEFESRYGQELAFLHSVQSSSEFHPASYPMVFGAFSLVTKRQGREADHPPPTTIEGKKTWIYASTPLYV
jgi:hypothetical protein